MSKVAQNIDELFHGALRLWAAGVRVGATTQLYMGKHWRPLVHILLCTQLQITHVIIKPWVKGSFNFSSLTHTHTLRSVHLKFRPSLVHVDWLGQRLRFKSRLSCKRSAHVCTSKLAWVTQHYQYTSDHQPLGGAQQRKVSGCPNAKTQENLMLRSLTKWLRIKERNPPGRVSS